MWGVGGGSGGWQVQDVTEKLIKLPYEVSAGVSLMLRRPRVRKAIQTTQEQGLTITVNYGANLVLGRIDWGRITSVKLQLNQLLCL